MLAHNVYFTLKDRTPAARAALLAGCRAHLTDHEGVVFFACGTLEPGLDRPVNVRDFDVAIHLIFSTRADHDRYQKHPRHLRFVSEHRETWANVRVFDSTVE